MQQVAVNEAGALAFNRANKAWRDKDYEACLQHAQAALAVASPLPQAALLRARALVHLERLDEAQAQYLDVVKADAASFDAWLELGNVERRLGRAERAVGCYDKAISARPHDARGYLASARLLEEMEQWDRAVPHMLRALGTYRDKPKERFETLHRMARYRLEMGQVARALELMLWTQSQGKLDAVDAELLHALSVDLGMALMRLGLREQGMAVFTLASASQDKTTLARLAEVSYSFNLWEEAHLVMQRRADLFAGNDVLLDLADFQVNCLQLDLAVKTLNKVDESTLTPKEREGIAQMQVSLLSKTGHSRAAYEVYVKQAEEGVKGKASAAAMTALYCDHLSVKEVAETHRRITAAWGKGARSKDSFRHHGRKGECLKLGIVTADLFYQHPVAIFMLPVLARLDPKRVEVTIYYMGDKGHDAETARAHACVRRWRDMVHLTEAQFARQVEEDAMDVVLDLSGHTGNNRLQWLARRVAPVQATFLGYPGSTGVPNIDWIIADRTVVPAEQQALYSERVAYLPNTVFCYAPREDYPFPLWDDAALARPLTFGSFNNVAKITPRVIDIWARILQRLPQSRLLLKGPAYVSAMATGHITEKFVNAGARADQLVYQGPSALPDMMADYGQVDIGLDTFPYNGGTTTLQAMWMGVPQVVLEGGHFVSRMGKSFMEAAGLGDWVAQTEDEYVEIAVAKASDRTALLELKRGMRACQLALPAWDVDGYTRDFEQLLHDIWAKG